MLDAVEVESGAAPRAQLVLRANEDGSVEILATGAVGELLEKLRELFSKK